MVPLSRSDSFDNPKRHLCTLGGSNFSRFELLAEAEGHRVLFTPPHHSDLQPIELLWAKLKGNIGRKYDANTTMSILKERLDEEFEASLGWNESVEGFIHKCSRLAAKFYKEQLVDDNNNRPADDPNINDSSDSDGSSDEDDNISIIGV